MSDLNVSLRPNENGVHLAKAPSRLVTFWQKTTLAVTDQRIAINRPRLLFGLVPIGNRLNNIELGSVSHTETKKTFNLTYLITSAFLFVLSLTWFISSFHAKKPGIDEYYSEHPNGTISPLILIVSLICMLLTIGLAANSYRSRLVIADNFGGQDEVDLSALAHTEVTNFSNGFNQYIGYTPQNQAPQSQFSAPQQRGGQQPNPTNYQNPGVANGYSQPQRTDGNSSNTQTEENGWG
ncbi:DUF1720 domain-containing protein [Corynebacterium kroppenstedtii]|uniref:Uncharacterized protein n=1 Tax=Corynebacterium kroppenstedtii (strain DSM 44385 / JCM 11950 / CIP 105744 / CCUG 35717) TaxID=645127 RepID=C4LHX5_CORK4|nr:DUF1720 domain-containing protein [Corynebacterium kroppenstedtii]ACR17430.1 hypothetical protein ckrop_0669 [Corynebacterium kroppenstedtii DSM 44385]QRP11089.1 DUF1720 domain-containing protein [Corynebacterium kroppenstedtii]